MPAYAIVQFSVKDPDTFGKYVPPAMASVAQHGGKYLVVTGPGLQQLTAMEGEAQHQVNVVLEWESEEALQRWYDSPEYQEIIGLRTSSTEGSFLMAPGFEAPPQ